VLVDNAEGTSEGVDVGDLVGRTEGIAVGTIVGLVGDELGEKTHDWEDEDDVTPQTDVPH
jgi:hypothetical protein